MKTDIEIEKMCCYCERSVPSYEAEKVICSKYGVVSASGSCGKFLYDPLKRIPRKPPKTDGFEPIGIDDDND